MDKLFQDETKIKQFLKIQTDLKSLKPKSNDNEIDDFINSIPQPLLDRKEDLKVICEMISYYARSHKVTEKQNAVKLFEKLMNPIKEKLQNCSSFFWSIFGGNYYLKLMFYEEGLISIEQIIISVQGNFKSPSTEYFLPEIIENSPEYFEKEVKNRYSKPYSKEYIDQFKKLRKKYFEWIRNSADYNDPSYKEIETNNLRFAIKTDDIQSFQKILANTNLSINSKINESVVENFLLYSNEMDLIEYATEFNSINIIKFLLMNGVEYNDNLIHFAISSNNYDIIKFIEDKKMSKFNTTALYSSLSLWNDEVIDYILSNYDEFNYLEKNDVKPEEIRHLPEIIRSTFCSVNFVFYESTLLPFFKNNPKYIEDNIYDILDISLNEKACYFFCEFLKYPKININYNFKEGNKTLLPKAVLYDNTFAVEILLNNPNIDINEKSYEERSAFQCACALIVDMNIIKLFCNHPDFKINFKDPIDHETAFDMTPQSGFFQAAQYIVDHFPDVEVDDFTLLLYHALVNDHYLSLKILLKLYFDRNESSTINNLVDEFELNFSNENSYEDEFLDTIKSVYNDISKK